MPVSFWFCLFVLFQMQKPQGHIRSLDFSQLSHLSLCLVFKVNFTCSLVFPISIPTTFKLLPVLFLILFVGSSGINHTTFLFIEFRLVLLLCCFPPNQSVFRFILCEFLSLWMSVYLISGSRQTQGQFQDEGNKECGDSIIDSKQFLIIEE